MGYYTNFELRIYDAADHAAVCRHEVIDLIEPLVPDCLMDYKFPYGHTVRDISENASSHDSMKWYDHKKDLQVLSARWPEYVFVLDGEGEENQDIWREVAWDGQCEHVDAELTYPACSFIWES